MLTWQEFGNFGITLTQTSCLIGVIVLEIVIKFGEFYNRTSDNDEKEED